MAGERFAVRNSGATAVVEGVGDHGCEYMTKGLVVVLGRARPQLCGRHDGGIAYVLDETGEFTATMCNLASVDLEPVEDGRGRATGSRSDRAALELTGSPRAEWILEHCDTMLPKFVKVFPHEYQARARRSRDGRRRQLRRLSSDSRSRSMRSARGGAAAWVSPPVFWNTSARLPGATPGDGAHQRLV